MGDDDRSLLILGGGGHARVVADAALASGRWGSVRFRDDAPPRFGLECYGPCDGPVADFAWLVARDLPFIVAVGDAGLRERWMREASERGARVETVIHPSAVVSSFARVEAGVAVLAGAVINPGARLGVGAIVNTGATVDHDSDIGEYAHVCPGVHVAGDVSVGARAWIGIGSAVRQGVTIGADAIVGAGAAVVADVDQGVTVVGVPARRLGART